MRSKTKRSALIAMALYVLGHGTATPRAQENVNSPGGALVARQVLDESLTAQRKLEVYQRPERLPFLSMFWKAPQRIDDVERGEEVRVIAVVETSLWRDRLVWLELEREGRQTPVWFRIGRQESASAALWRNWKRTPDDEEER